MDVFVRLKDTLVQIGRLLPPLFLALVILAAGYLVARLIERVVDRFLDRVQFDRSAERWGVTEAVERTGTRLDPARVVGNLLFWGVMLIVILLAATALGLQNINDVFANLVGYVPSIFAAIIVIVLGLVLGEFVRALILTSAGGVEGVPTLAKVAKALIIAMSLLMALEQIGLAADIVKTAFELVLGAAVLAVALAFGLGNTKLAGEITRHWYESGRTATRAARGHPKEGAARGAETAAPAAIQRELGIEEAPVSEGSERGS
jgi:hypothetical protein